MKLLETLIYAPGVPGREHIIRNVIQEAVTVRSIFDDIYVDALGSLICVKKPCPKDKNSKKKPLKVLLTAHLDQIGFLVSHIGDDGFLRLHPVGAFDPRTLFARTMLLITENGEELIGVINPEGRPLHTASLDELNTIPALEKFYLDLSLPVEQVRAKVQLGNLVVFTPYYSEVGDSIVATSLDDRVGCWALISAIEELKYHDCEIFIAFTSQEEVGSRGAQPVSYALKPDIGIACDTTVCDVVPGSSPERWITRPGDGIALQIADSSTLSDMDLVRMFENIALEHGIKCQRALMLGGGQDGARIQVSRGGVRTIVLSCPVKYLHTATEMVNRDDLYSYRDILRAVLMTL